MKKKILIAASTGFVGRNLYEYFLQTGKYDIDTLNSKDIDFTDEMGVTTYFMFHTYEVVLLCANYGIGRNPNNDVNKTLEYNLRIVLNFEKCRQAYGKLIYLGSGAEYDKRRDIHMVREEEIESSIPVDQYGLYKYTVNKIIEQSNNWCNLRLFGIFGKYEDWKTKFISNLCCKAIMGIPLSIRQNVYFDYLWIEDFCRIVDWFIEHECRYHSYNVVSGSPVSLIELTDIVKDVSKKELPVYICKEGLAREYTASNQRLREEMKEFRFTDIQESVGKLYHWYEERKEEITMYPLIYQ